MMSQSEYTGSLRCSRYFFTGLEMAYSMILVGFFGFIFLMTFQAAASLVVKDFFDDFTTYSYTVIPLFIIMGEFASNSNIAKRLYLGAHRWFGHIPGGLAMTTVAGATAFKAMCGSTLATVGTFSNLALPEMNRYGYKTELSAGTIASVSTIGMILPPSTVLIIYRARGRAIHRPAFPCRDRTGAHDIGSFHGGYSGMGKPSACDSSPGGKVDVERKAWCDPGCSGCFCCVRHRNRRNDNRVFQPHRGRHNRYLCNFPSCSCAKRSEFAHAYRIF